MANKAQSMKVAGPLSPDPFRAEDDANTLNRAALIVGDRSRHAAAKAHIHRQMRGHGIMGTVPVPSAAPGFASHTGKSGGTNSDRSGGQGRSASMSGTKAGGKKGATTRSDDTVRPSSAGSQKNAGAKARTSSRGTKAGNAGPGFGSNDASYRFGKKR
jgi:hypothetical protein